jgi:uncharacterized protein YdeI (YjbR/CyaY-like superfamily)
MKKSTQKYNENTQDAIMRIITKYESSLSGLHPITMQEMFTTLHCLRFIDVTLNSTIDRTLTVRELMPIFSTAINRISQMNDRKKDIEDIR